jgi:hypothetical protein
MRSWPDIREPLTEAYATTSRRPTNGPLKVLKVLFSECLHAARDQSLRDHLCGSEDVIAERCRSAWGAEGTQVIVEGEKLVKLVEARVCSLQIKR